MNLAKLTESLTRDEGERLVPYLDNLNLWTACIGRCLEKNPISAAEWKWLLDNKAIEVRFSGTGSQYLFSNDVRTALMQIKARCDFWDRLDDLRQNILIEMCFQLGIDHLLAFNKMFAAMRIGDWKEAKAQGLDSKWAREDSPARAELLMNALESGAWPV